MSQLEYTIDQGLGIEGALADGHHYDADSGTMEGPIPTNFRAGHAVKLGSKDNLFAPVTAGADKPHGIMIYRPLIDGAVLEKSSQTILRKGRVYVRVIAAVVRGEAAHVLPDGTISNTGGVKIPSEFRTSAAAGELAVLDVNFPALSL